MRGFLRYLMFCAWRSSHRNETVYLYSDPPPTDPDYFDHDTVRIWFVTMCSRCGLQWMRWDR